MVNCQFIEDILCFKMPAVQRILKNLVISVLILVVKGDPMCKFYDDYPTYLICTASNSKPYTLQKGLVSDNNTTAVITLRQCKIIGIKVDSFDGLTSLDYLDLSENKISELLLGTLDEMYPLRHLNLSYNRLTDLSLGVFDQVPNIQVLDLKGNRLHSLKPGVFHPLSSLKHLDLSSNYLIGSNLSPNHFDQSRRIEFMDFSSNDMSGAPEDLLQAFENISILNLERCSLNEIPKFAIKSNLKTMKHLMLSNNKISKIDDPKTFYDLEELEILNLAKNVIETIEENVLKPLKKMETIVLMNNKLENIPDTLFKDMSKLINIDLSHNLIDYVPVNAFRGSKVKNLTLTDNKFTYLPDNFLLELKNSGATVTQFYFDQNLLQCGCLKDILHEVKSLGVQYNSVEYDGKHSVCITIENRFNCIRDQLYSEGYVYLYSLQDKYRYTG